MIPGEPVDIVDITIPLISHNCGKTLDCTNKLMSNFRMPETLSQPKAN